MLSLSDFTLFQAVLEVRYDHAYSLWDRSGALWAKANRVWTNLKAGQTQPSVTTFLLDNQYELSVSLERSHIIDMKPSSSLKDFMERANDFINLVAQSLDIEYFTRIGFRLAYVKTCFALE